MDADTIKLMAELAWLAYEEGCGRISLSDLRDIAFMPEDMMRHCSGAAQRFTYESWAETNK